MASGVNGNGALSGSMLQAVMRSVTNITASSRVSDGSVLIVDTVNMGEDVERAEKLRDPSHVRNYSQAEWLELVEQAGLRVAETKTFEHSFDLDAWLARTGCTGEDAREVVRLLGDRARDGRLTLAKLAIHAVKEG